MIITRPIKDEEDLLCGNEFKKLIITNLGGEICATIEPPKDGWTHSALENISYDEHSPHGWDAYLGSTDEWVGSSEV